ncbi:c-type cytochrome [Alicycliphilus sp. T452]
MKLLLIGMAMLLPLAARPAGGGAPSAQDVAVLAGNCVTCHGPQGQAPGTGGSIPSLRGRPAGVLWQRMQALKAMKTGATARATIMPLLLQGYDDAQLQALARWFAGQEQP